MPRPVLCRDYYTRKLKNKDIMECSAGNKCQLEHPKEITPAISKEYERKTGFCYCGASLKTLMNRRFCQRNTDHSTPSLFFVVCGRTRKSIQRCFYPEGPAPRVSF
jgi:hypothetical protein